MQEKITKKSLSLDRDAVYTKTVSFLCVVLMILLENNYVTVKS